MFARKSLPPDRRPPPLPLVPSLGACERCGADVAPFDRMPGQGLRHFVCDVATRADVTRRIEAMRSMHRAALALAHVPVAKAQLTREIGALPDAADTGEVLEALGRVRLSVECAPDLGPEQRRLALSYLESLCRKLGG